MNPDEDIIKKKIFIEKKKKTKDKQISEDEKEEEVDGGVIRVDLLDIPRIHNPNDPIAFDFINAISGVEDPSYLFKCESVKAIVEFRWKLCYKFILKQ